MIRPLRALSLSANWLAYSPSLASGDILAGVDACARDLQADGIVSVELPIAHMNSEILDLDDAFWANIQKPFTLAGIGIESVHGPVFAWAPEDRNLETQRLVRYAEVASLLGAQALVVHPVHHPALHVCQIAHGALEADLHWASIVSQHLEGTSTRLAVENVPHNSWAYLERLFERLPDSVGLCFDTGHYQVRPEVPLQALLERIAERVTCWHLSDNDGFCDAHRPPGEGRFDWATWLGFASVSDAPQIIELSLPAITDSPNAIAETREQSRQADRSTARLFSSLASTHSPDEPAQ